MNHAPSIKLPATVLRKHLRLQSHCFISPSKVAPAAIVLTAARLVVLEEGGKVVWRFVFVVAAAARAAEYAVRAVLAYMMNDDSSQNNAF